MGGTEFFFGQNRTLYARARSLQSDARRRGPPRASLLIFRSRSAVLPARAGRTSAARHGGVSVPPPNGTDFVLVVGRQAGTTSNVRFAIRHDRRDGRDHAMC